MPEQVNSPIIVSYNHTFEREKVRSSSLKYRDLPWNLKRRIDASGPMMQPSKSENPTVRNILNRLKTAEDRSLLADAHVSARQKREVIDLIEDYLNKYTTSRSAEL